jgi:Class III cytochrome C family
MPFGWLSILSLLLLASGPAPEGPDTIRFETDIGPAFLNHREHQRRFRDDCSICHHQAEAGRRRACSLCHKGRLEAPGKEGAPSYFTVKMNLCRGCHLAKRESGMAPKAPIHCQECHDMRAKARQEGSGVRD